SAGALARSEQVDHMTDYFHDVAEEDEESGKRNKGRAGPLNMNQEVRIPKSIYMGLALVLT
ncbi:unnamed protein product, partial [Amoebophrya sp. A120]